MSVEDWIKTSDRLPEHEQAVNFIVEASEESRFYYLNGMRLGGVFIFHAPNAKKYPSFSIPGLGLWASYWQPMPEPPSEYAKLKREAEE